MAIFNANLVMHLKGEFVCTEIPDKDINPRRVNLARYNSDRLSPSFERITGPYKPQG
jgi:ATP-dependent phosphofructokinase / diphosphate-dependent phosphofructokinase